MRQAVKSISWSRSGSHDPASVLSQPSRQPNEPWRSDSNPHTSPGRQSDPYPYSSAGAWVHRQQSPLGARQCHGTTVSDARRLRQQSPLRQGSPSRGHGNLGQSFGAQQRYLSSYSPQRRSLPPQYSSFSSQRRPLSPPHRSSSSQQQGFSMRFTRTPHRPEPSPPMQRDSIFRAAPSRSLCFPSPPTSPRKSPRLHLSPFGSSFHEQSQSREFHGLSSRHDAAPCSPNGNVFNAARTTHGPGRASGSPLRHGSTHVSPRHAYQAALERYRRILNTSPGPSARLSSKLLSPMQRSKRLSKASPPGGQKAQPASSSPYMHGMSRRTNQRSDALQMGDTSPAGRSVRQASQGVPSKTWAQAEPTEMLAAESATSTDTSSSGTEEYAARGASQHSLHRSPSTVTLADRSFGNHVTGDDFQNSPSQNDQPCNYNGHVAGSGAATSGAEGGIQSRLRDEHSPLPRSMPSSDMQQTGPAFTCSSQIGPHIGAPQGRHAGSECAAGTSRDVPPGFREVDHMPTPGPPWLHDSGTGAGAEPAANHGSRAENLSLAPEAPSLPVYGIRAGAELPATSEPLLHSRSTEHRWAPRQGAASSHQSSDDSCEAARHGLPTSSNGNHEPTQQDFSFDQPEMGHSEAGHAMRSASGAAPLIAQILVHPDLQQAGKPRALESGQALDSHTAWSGDMLRSDMDITAASMQRMEERGGDTDALRKHSQEAAYGRGAGPLSAATRGNSMQSSTSALRSRTYDGVEVISEP